MKLHVIKFIFLFYGLKSLNVFAQRVYQKELADYSYQTFSIKKRAHPYFKLENGLINVKSINNKFVVVIDTFESNDYTFKKYVSENDYLVLSHELDSSNKEQNFINSYVTDRKTNTKYYLTSSFFFYENQLYYFALLRQTDCCILATVNKARKREITLFNYQDKKVSKYEISRHFEILGNNDSSIYIHNAYTKFEINGKRFKKGSVLNISSNGIKTLSVSTKDIKYENYAPIYFYNEDFSVQYKALSKLPMNSNIEVFYQLNILHKNKVLDSIFGIDDYNSSNIKTYITYYDNQLSVFSPSYYKLYTKDICYTWDYNNWLNKIEGLKRQTNDYFLKGDTLFLTKEIQISDNIGFNKETNQTFNNIQLTKGATFFQLVMAFNIKTNEFLGYPDIEFTTKLSK